MASESNVMKVFLLIKYMMIANAATIENIYVPEVVQSGSIDVVLCCQYFSLDNESVQWLFNGNKVPEEWYLSVKNSDIPDIRTSLGRLTSVTKRSQLSVQRVTPAMGGNYTCEVRSGGSAVRQTKRMSVFSQENDFILKINYHLQKRVDVKCTAWGLHPRPEITLEIDNRPASKQVQRVWWTEDALFTAEGTASFRGLAAGRHEVTCRLYLPLADYTAIMKKYVHVDNETSCGTHAKVSNSALLISTVFVSLASRTLHYYP